MKLSLNQICKNSYYTNYNSVANVCQAISKLLNSVRKNRYLLLRVKKFKLYRLLKIIYSVKKKYLSIFSFFKQWHIAIFNLTYGILKNKFQCTSSSIHKHSFIFKKKKLIKFMSQLSYDLRFSIGILYEIKYWYKKIVLMLFPTTIQVLGLRNFTKLIELFKTLNRLLHYLRKGKIPYRVLEKKTALIMENILNKYYHLNSVQEYSNFKLLKFFRSKIIIFLRIDYYSKNVRKIDFNSIKKIFRPRIVSLFSKKNSF
mmetsp:Transcript_35113/g.56883  ORF Transcript_35113/g.56883 Transcript_35113/m.56883 type:complete len:257 (+) Transcript_35113:68-838(+)